MSEARNLFIKPSPGERIETTLILPENTQATLYGQVTRADASPVSGVLVLLFPEENAAPVDQTVTDEAGRFCFGPLEPDRLYTLHLHERHRAVRVLEVSL